MGSWARYLTAAALSAAALSSGCGGGDAARSSSAEQAFAAVATQTPPRSDRLRALSGGLGEGRTASAATVTITAEQFFQALAIYLPDLFPGTPLKLAFDSAGIVFDVRFYAGTNNYVAVGSNGVVYALGAFTGNVVVQVGPLQAMADPVCAKVNCGSAGSALNGCTMPADQALVTGNRYQATFVSSAPGAPGSQYTVEAVVDGPTTFNGQSAIKSTTRMTGLQGGADVDTTTRVYEQVADGGLYRRLGIETVMTAPVRETSTTVYDPPDLSTEFTLQPQASITKTLTGTTTGSGIPGSYTQTTSLKHTFEARETITVPAGTYDTCRYRQAAPGSSSYTLQWFIVGKGLGVRMEGRTGTGTLMGRAEMTSGTINGAPL